MEARCVAATPALVTSRATGSAISLYEESLMVCGSRLPVRMTPFSAIRGARESLRRRSPHILAAACRECVGGLPRNSIQTNLGLWCPILFFPLPSTFRESAVIQYVMDSRLQVFCCSRIRNTGCSLFQRVCLWSALAMTIELLDIDDRSWLHLLGYGIVTKDRRMYLRDGNGMPPNKPSRQIRR